MGGSVCSTELIGLRSIASGSWHLPKPSSKLKPEPKPTQKKAVFV